MVLWRGLCCAVGSVPASGFPAPPRAGWHRILAVPGPVAFAGGIFQCLGQFHGRALPSLVCVDPGRPAAFGFVRNTLACASGVAIALALRCCIRVVPDCGSTRLFAGASGHVVSGARGVYLVFPVHWVVCVGCLLFVGLVLADHTCGTRDAGACCHWTPER